LTFFSILLFLPTPETLGQEFAATEVQVFADTLLSGGQKVVVERFQLPGSRKCPALIMLHALDGMSPPYADQYRGAARRFAGRGYVVLIVHYFQRTPGFSRDLAQLRVQFLRCAAGTGSSAEEKNVQAYFHEWMDVVGDTITLARTRSDVDGERLGLVGFSLGGPWPWPWLPRRT
jgi:dienelactone hydrolase